MRANLTGLQQYGNQARTEGRKKIDKLEREREREMEECKKTAESEYQWVVHKSEYNMLFCQKCCLPNCSQAQPFASKVNE